MKYKKFKENINFAGFKNKEFARLLDISQQSVTNYSKKGVPQYAALISELLMLLRYNDIDFDPLVKKFIEENNEKI